jgi:non-ribosomal peptide synthetase-like protein
MTYAELDRRSNQLARWLAQQGIGSGDCVGLLLPRSLDVYVALLGVLKAGAAYVPLDPDYPSGRVQFILSDCQARAVLTTCGLSSKVQPESARSTDQLASRAAPLTVCLDAPSVDLSSCPDEPLDLTETQTSPSDLCYVIYTSGTTGRPKGVQIEHRSVCHLVRTEGQLFQVRPADRVYQGLSLAFDASVEEIWLAFFAGATLVVGTEAMAHGGPELSATLRAAQISVLSCVPTLLAMMDEDVPTLRLLILGGEVCPPDLVKRWWKPGRKLFNTYGPTEATVIATATECEPGRAVTIGKPIPGYSAVILDQNLQSVSPGTPGELCLGGVGLARGYLGRPELTREKFISPNGERLYRTGDLARWTSDGELEFLGRVDGQVKIRGFRVELSEIESVLMEEPGVKAAAVALHEGLPGVQQIVAYIVSRSAAPLDQAALRARMRARLPGYMVPALLEFLPELPTLSSGKVDRRALPQPSQAGAQQERVVIQPKTPLEKQLKAVWQPLFRASQVSVTDDFFLDLGGHSLLAARMVSELRKTPAFRTLSMLDVYEEPTIAALAARFKDSETCREEGPAPGAGSSTSATTRSPVPFLRHFMCGAAQLVSLVFILSFFALQWLAPYLTYTVLTEEEYDLLPSILGALASLILLYPLMVLIPIAVKWLVIGRYKPGVYPLWGAYYFRWWLVTTIEAAVPVGYMAGTPLLNIYLRLMGARVGRNVHLDSDGFAIYDLLQIGDDSSINVDTNLLGYTVEDGYLKLGSITLGKRCFVGTRAAVRENTVLEDDAALEDLSLLPRGKTIPRGQVWSGSPAEQRLEPAGRAHVNASQNDSPEPGIPGRPSLLRRFCVGLLHALGLLLFPVLVVLPLFPGIVLMNRLNCQDQYYSYLFLSPLVALSFVVLLCLEIAAVKWLLLGKVQPGQYPLNSLFYFRKWFVDQTMDLSLDILGPLYASVYLVPWYRLLGARLGKGAEVSTASFISPDLLSLGEESFIADSVSLGAPRVRGGVIKLGCNHVGRRSFIGNSAMLPPDTVIGDSVLIGCLSAPPARPADALREDSAWLGSPAIFLPERQRTTGFGEEATFNPSAKLRALRAAVEFVRLISPSTGFIVLLSLMFSALLLLHDSYSLGVTLLFFPVLYVGCGLMAALVTIVAKWLLVGRYRAGEQPLWCTFVWRNELINALHEHLAGPFLVGPLSGTPFLSWYFRLLGARIGKRVYMETTDLSEFDLVRIGDEAALNADCTIQTHLFEDRVMKISTIDIGPHCTVGAGSLVLYDTRMEEGSLLGDLSLLMKGEGLAAGTAWQGIPARPS